MKLGEVLKGKSPGVYKISAGDCIADAAAVLSKHKIGALLVEDEGKMVGILSERDIVRGMAPHGANLQDVAVSELMTSEVIFCSPDDTVNEAMAMMSDRKIRHLPVFDGDELVGFISISDLVRCRIVEVQAEADAMRQYIAS
jgi:CBS domain-containing protein